MKILKPVIFLLCVFIFAEKPVLADNAAVIDGIQQAKGVGGRIELYLKHFHPEDDTELAKVANQTVGWVSSEDQALTIDTLLTQAISTEEFKKNPQYRKKVGTIALIAGERLGRIGSDWMLKISDIFRNTIIGFAGGAGLGMAGEIFAGTQNWISPTDHHYFVLASVALGFSYGFGNTLYRIVKKTTWPYKYQRSVLASYNACTPELGDL